MEHQELREAIEAAFERRKTLTPQTAGSELCAALDAAIGLLDRGELRVAERREGGWSVNEWLKKAVLLYFRTHANQLSDAGYARFYDKVPLKFADLSAAEFARTEVRVVPHAIVRRGAYIAPNVVLMPCFVNIGAYIDSGTMVDTWATVGSCVQVGKNVHLSGGVGIGGVLEPLQASPTIIEDHCFIGARSEIVEGVVIGAGSVISMGVFIGQSTRILDRATGEILQGRVPPGSVVVPGTLPAKDGSHSLYCAVIVKRVDAQTRAKTSINELLRVD
jgi:2,3,4,5-tetrahydropyridine-2-carboxylate N-succinyltransferase